MDEVKADGVHQVSDTKVLCTLLTLTDFYSFRTFIFGITSQSMFPNGVVYEGLNNDEPMSFRGESGANDSMGMSSLPPIIKYVLTI